ncbi:hypothetical protein GQ53DRAFT_784306 [Thozetella sp. PMI_491]|nr:hypothetical protein GQ53DRAFT_784306 [Thozetella sp. PMI_491]
MAEAVGMASGLLALATFAFNTSVALKTTIQSFQSHPKRIRDLLEELEALTETLAPLQETIREATDLNLSALALPLERCGNACQEFEGELNKCVSQSGGTRASFRDWARVQYMRDDIDSFRRLLDGYKSTINLALTHATLRISSHTAESLESQRSLAEATTEDLEERLSKLDEKIKLIIEQSEATSDLDAAELKRMEEEKLSTEKCLHICRQLSEHIDQIQLASKRSAASSGSSDVESVSEKVFSEGLQEVKKSLANTAARLEKHREELRARMVAKSKTTMALEEDLADFLRLQDEFDATRQAMEFCAKAESHLREGVSVIDNYATGDALQFMVSTEGKVLHGKNRGLGWRSRQVGGYLSNETVQQISKDMSRIVVQSTEKTGSSPPASVARGPGDDAEHNPSSAVKEHWTRGFKLGDKSPTRGPPPDSATTSKEPSGSQAR